jgi:DNA-binding transcriptional regulator LsrR (DeoR family)
MAKTRTVMALERPAADADAKSGETFPSSRRTARLRLRAAWMYYVEEMTQNEVADALGIGRVTVARLLTDARALNEVRVTLSRDVAELPRLEVELQKRFSLADAVVAPLAAGDPFAPIGAATGQYLSSVLRSNMKLGLGWGRTLSSCLGFLEDKPLPGLSVLSLLGGVTKARATNPSEFAWQFARNFQAQCYLIPAPALVDSVATKTALIDRCGLRDVFEQARELDTILFSVGGVQGQSSLFDTGMASEDDRSALVELGAIGNVLYHFFDRDGRLVDHSINDRIMAIPFDVLRRVPNRVLVSGGADKVAAMIGAMRLLAPTVCITDEKTAAAMLAHTAQD